MTQTDYFAKAIVFGWWLIFKIVSFLEYLVFSQAVFLHRTTLIWLKNRFLHFFLILIFDPNSLFSKGYSLWLMVDFQNRLISRIFVVFLSGFLDGTTLVWWKNRFWHVVLNFNFWPKLTIYFPKARAFPWWSIFKIVSFLKYLAFSQAAACTKQL